MSQVLAETDPAAAACWRRIDCRHAPRPSTKTMGLGAPSFDQRPHARGGRVIAESLRASRFEGGRGMLGQFFDDAVVWNNAPPHERLTNNGRPAHGRDPWNLVTLLSAAKNCCHVERCRLSVRRPAAVNR